MNICGNVSLFEHSQYFIDAGASLDQRPSIPVKDEVAALILAKSKQDGFVGSERWRLRAGLLNDLQTFPALPRMSEAG